MSHVASDSAVKLWLGSVGSSSGDCQSFFSRFYRDVLGKDERFRGLSPSQLLEWQENATGRDRYTIGLLARTWINGLKMTQGSKKTRMGQINSFFSHGYAPLPPDPAFKFGNSVPPVDGDLPVEDLVTIVQNSNLKYATVFLMLAQGILDEKRFCHINVTHAELVLDAVSRKVGVFRLPLPPRKGNPEPFFTMLDATRSDFAVSFRKYAKTTTHDLSDCLFVNDQGNPVTEANIRAYFHRRAIEKGLIRDLTPACRCGNKHTVRKIVNSRKYGTRKVAYECGCGEVQFACELGVEFRNSLKGHRTGKHPHEIRDLMRSRWAQSGGDRFVAEFIMGHSVKSLDKNKYEKVKYQRGMPEAEYLRALPWLNILSEDPLKVDRTHVDLELEGYKREVAELRHDMEAFRLERKKMWEKLDKIK